MKKGEIQDLASYEINVYRIDAVQRKTMEKNKNVHQCGNSLNTQQTVSGSNRTLLTAYCHTSKWNIPDPKWFTRASASIKISILFV